MQLINQLLSYLVPRLSYPEQQTAQYYYFYKDYSVSLAWPGRYQYFSNIAFSVYTLPHIIL